MATRGRPRKFDRDAVLLDAMKVFWAKGYEGASLADLTGAMGIAAPSLYAAFGDKDRLFRESVEKYVELGGSRMTGVLEEHDTARESVKAMLTTAAHLFADPTSPGGCLLTLGAINCTPEHSAHEAYLAGYRRVVRDAIDTRLARAKEEGEFPADADLDGMVNFYGAVLQGFALRAKDGATLDQMLKSVDHALAAIDMAAA